jgi:predicted phage baseplate assembly protein
LGPNPERPAEARDDGWPFAIKMVRNPLAAVGGTDSESMESARLLAPAAIHQHHRRAVTEADWAAAAEGHPAVARATALYRWTGSWHTVQVIIDPKNRNGLTPALRESITAHLAERKLSGADVQIAEPIYVPLEIALTVEALPGHHQADVRARVLHQLSNQQGGFFHPDRFTFGQSLFLSHLYAAVESLLGVKSVQVTRFNRYAPTGAASGLASGVIAIGAREIARCDNDPNYPENGLLHLTVRGAL